MSNLKKCPFCGGEAKIYGYYFIQCTKCGVSTLTHTDRESAINTWNTRIPTIEVKPVVHGEWKRVGSGSLYDTYECTNCHRPPKWDCLGDNHWRIAFTDICPHCGADMRGEKHD